MGIGTLLYYILRIVKPYRWLLVVNIRLSMLILFMFWIKAVWLRVENQMMSTGKAGVTRKSSMPVPVV